MKKNNQLVYKNFITGFESASENAGQYLKIIKKSKNFTTSANTGRNSNVRKNFSLTELLTYLKCPAYYKWRYLYNIPEPLNRNIDVGLKVHRHIQVLTAIRYKEIISDNHAPCSDITETMYLDSLKNPEEKEDIYNLVYNFYKSNIFNFSDISAITMEQLFYWNLQGYVISCKTDRLDKQKSGNLRIIDYKTSNSNNHGRNKSYINQLKAYTCGTSSIYNVNTRNIFSYLLYLKDGCIDEKIFSDKELALFKELIITGIKNINRYEFNVNIKESCKKDCCYYNLCN